MTPDDSAPRRRRRRPTSETNTPSAPSAPSTAARTPAPHAAAVTDTGPPPAARVESAKPRRKRPTGDSGSERGLRDLVGAGPSQVGVSGALRARDVNRPTDEDIAAAERDLVIVRRSRPDGAG